MSNATSLFVDSSDSSETELSEQENAPLNENNPNKCMTLSTISSSEQNKKMTPKKIVDTDSDSSEDYTRPLRRPSKKRPRLEDFTGDGPSTDSSVDERRRSNRKRNWFIRRVESSSSESQSDSEDSESDSVDFVVNKENTPKKGRRNIRKVKTVRQLDAKTIKATAEERERIKRMEERQKLLNQLFVKPEDADVLQQLVLDVDKNTQEIVLEVDRELVKFLKPHQASGVKFMWDACFESLDQVKIASRGSGCILSHCMGLGKTFTTVTLIHTLLLNTEKTRVKRVLVVAPKSTLPNWASEFKMWLRHAQLGTDCVHVYEIYSTKNLLARAYKIDGWHANGGVMLISYDMFRRMTYDALNASTTSKIVKEFIKNGLIDPGPDLVVCDEGHLLKNGETGVALAMARIRTLRRIVLTGTPLQNNLKEYYVMIQFVKPNLLGKKKDFMRNFANPIVNGQYSDSTKEDIRNMKHRSHVLHRKLEGCVHRKDYEVLVPLLPPRHEYILSIQLSDVQVKLYEYYMLHKGMLFDVPDSHKRSSLFEDYNSLYRIWTHPLVLRLGSDRYEDNLRALERRNLSLKRRSDFTAGSDDTDEYDEESYRTVTQPVRDFGPRKTRSSGPSVGNAPSANTRRSDPTPGPSRRPINPTEWWMKLVPEDALTNINYSGKLLMLLAILEECGKVGDKLLLFSQSLFTLDAIEHLLLELDKKGGVAGAKEWKLGLDYFRLDGSTPTYHRHAAATEFNRAENKRTRLFLISTRAGGLGINLVGANRVIIFDVSWNPSNDIQSIFRVYRFGQLKPCYIYRFSAFGTMEEKIYERQVTKQAISKRVIDEHQIDRHYTMADLRELYAVNLSPTAPRDIPVFPEEDLLLAELLKKNVIVYNYHEHNSLLENRQEETLDAEERKVAWDEYERGVKTSGKSRKRKSVGEATEEQTDIKTEVDMKVYHQQIKRMKNKFKHEAGSSLSFKVEPKIENVKAEVKSEEVASIQIDLDTETSEPDVEDITPVADPPIVID